ncbi:hypothetical protein SK128_007764, partial [Halocaridina rubra]
GRLRRHKALFWHDIYSLPKPCRQLVSDAITDLLDLRFGCVDNALALLGKEWQTRALVIFAAQILFTYDAGQSQMINMMQYIKVYHEHLEMFSAFVDSLKPFHLQLFSTKHFRFADSKPIVTMLRNSPNLRVIYFAHNICPYVLETLMQCCKNIEKVSMKLFSYIQRGYRLGGDFLFKIFFGNASMASVLRCINDKEELLLSFPNLQEIYIDINSCNTSIQINEFMLCLQHFYPHIKTKWSKYVNIRNPQSKLNSSDFELPLVFRGNVKHYWDVIEIGLIDKMQELYIDSRGQDVVFAGGNHLEFEVGDVIDPVSKNIVEKLTELHACDSLGFVFYKMDLNIETSFANLLEDLVKKIRKLELNLPFCLDCSELFSALNACPSLQAFSICAERMVTHSSKVTLNCFPKLCFLKIDIPTATNTPSQSGALLRRQLIVSSPGLVMLDIKGLIDEEFESVLSLGYLSKLQTLVLRTPFPTNLVHFVTQMKSLSGLMLNSYERPVECFFSLKQGYGFSELKIYCDDLRNYRFMC